MNDTTKAGEINIPVKPVQVPAKDREEVTLVLVPIVPIPVENPGMVSRRIPIPVSCAQCGSRMTRDPSTVPFRVGPFKGGFLCRECWILYWDDRPELLADVKSRQWVSGQAREIRLKRVGDGSELLFEDGESRAFLTDRGTVLVDLKRLPFGGPDEYDGERFKILLKMAKAFQEKLVPGYEGDPPKANP
jgi:hypothetical protein